MTSRDSCAGATIDETKLNDAYGAEATAHTSRVRYLHSEQATVRIDPYFRRAVK